MGNQISTFICNAWDRVKEAVSNAVRFVAGPIVQYVVKHPWKTALHIGKILLFLNPLFIATPLLSMLGWGSVGIRAGTYSRPVKIGILFLTSASGSMAAFVQSTMGGNIAAGGVFATLQSAAMGGYGAATVVGIGRIAAAGAIASEGIMAAADVGAQQAVIEEADHIDIGKNIMDAYESTEI
jgi:hypothetical protein